MALLVIALGVPSTNAQDKSDNLKAVYLFNFGNYIEWPARAFSVTTNNSPFVIGVIGKEHSVCNLLVRIGEKKKIGTRAISAVMLAPNSDFSKCQILYIPDSVPPDEVASIISRCKGLPVLIVGETPDFAQPSSGGGINFFVEGTNIRFEINKRQLESRELKASSKLLQLGVLVSE